MNGEPNVAAVLGVVASALAVLSSLSLWFLVRLVHSFDTFKKEMRATVGEHGEQLARIQERHELEDKFENAGRRRGDRARGAQH